MRITLSDAVLLKPDDELIYENNTGREYILKVTRVAVTSDNIVIYLDCFNNNKKHKKIKSRTLTKNDFDESGMCKYAVCGVF